MPVTLVDTLPPIPTPAVMGPIPLAWWACAVSYSVDPGLRQIPVGGPLGTQSRIVRKHGGKAVKIIQWLAIGWGGKPPLPSLNTQQANEVPGPWEIGKPAEGKFLDGQDIVAVFGRYTYLLQAAPTPSDVLAFCIAPWASSPSVTVYSLSPADFSTLLVGPSLAPAGFSGNQITY